MQGRGTSFAFLLCHLSNIDGNRNNVSLRRVHLRDTLQWRTRPSTISWCIGHRDEVRRVCNVVNLSTTTEPKYVNEAHDLTILHRDAIFQFFQSIALLANWRLLIRYRCSIPLGQKTATDEPAVKHM